MHDEIPSLIQLSPVQREILNLIIEDQLSIHKPVLSERAILLWSEGVSESATSEKLAISQETVKSLRYRWWSSVPRLAAAEKRSQKVFNDLVSLIFHITTDCSTSASTQRLPATHDTASQEKSDKHKELRPATRALIEILHHKPKVYGINKSTWTQETLAIAYETLYGQRPSRFTVGRLLREAGLSWKKSHRVLTSPDPKYREKVELLLQTLQSLKPDEDLFFVDELGPLQVKRYGGRSYTPKKMILTHPQRQQSKGFVTLYGALSAITNQVTWFYGESKDSMGIINLAEILFNQ
jgi:transposase